jgi:hypothetical protein
MPDTNGTTEFDQVKAEAFADRFVNALNDGALGLMISIGHRTGLFDTMSQLPPATSQEIAAAAGLNERYVREWLGAVVTGRVVEVDPATGLYALPAEHAALLTRAAGADNLAVFIQYLAVMGAVEDEIVECFRSGEGVGAMWGQEKTLEYLDRAGFRSVEVNELAHDIQNNWYVVRKLSPHAAAA